MSAAKTKLHELAQASKKAAAELTDGIEGLRQRIAELNHQLRLIDLQNVDPETALARADEWVEVQISEAKQVAPDAERFARSHGRYTLPQSSPHLVTAYLGRMIAAEIKKDIQSFYARNDGASDAERASSRARVERELLDFELAEESMIRAAEAAGLAIIRRADANPLAVLAHDEVLP